MEAENSIRGKGLRVSVLPLGSPRDGSEALDDATSCIRSCNFLCRKRGKRLIVTGAWIYRMLWVLVVLRVEG